MKEARGFTPDEKNKRLSDITKNFTKCKEYGDDKLGLAMQTYDMIDKHIRRLDADLARFEADLKEKALGGRSAGAGPSTSGNECETTNKKNSRKSLAGDSKKQKKRKEMEDKEDSKSNKKAKIAGAVQDSPGTNVSLNALLPLSVAASDVLDMPVDPNEPTYCLCHQVSYGEMIGCDNQDCPIEWFHFGCVNLTTKPKGKWYCPKCREDREKKEEVR